LNKITQTTRKKASFLGLAFLSTALSACSIVGDTGVEEASYATQRVSNEQNIEIRTYESMVLVSTKMPDGERNDAFRRLFDYITGANIKQSDIAMTAPVLMNEAKQGENISMTAPVFMNESQDTQVMSFVMPDSFTLASTPKPTNPKVWVHEVKNYQVAAITFSGTLSNSNVAEHTQKLTKWLTQNGYQAKGQPVEAAYNGPFTLPWYRKNEILIEIK
jgi:effector-binding domain-containing protein